MVRASIGAGALLRPNNSLAGVAGSSGLAAAGSGCGLTVPLSCAAVPSAAKRTANVNDTARQPAIFIGALSIRNGGPGL